VNKLVFTVYILGVISLAWWIGYIYYASVWPAHPKHSLDEWAFYCFPVCIAWQFGYDLYRWAAGRTPPH
jgi:hypothetical protein